MKLDLKISEDVLNRIRSRLKSVKQKPVGTWYGEEITTKMHPETLIEVIRFLREQDKWKLPTNVHDECVSKQAVRNALNCSTIYAIDNVRRIDAEEFYKVLGL